MLRLSQFCEESSSVSTHELTWNFRNWERIALPFFKPDPARKPMRLQKNSHVFVQSQPLKTSRACAQLESASRKDRY